MVVVLSTWESSRRGGGRVAVRLESTSHWCTYQRHCGNAGTRITGVRTSGVVGTRGPRVRRKSGHLRWATNRRTGGPSDGRLCQVSPWYFLTRLVPPSRSHGSSTWCRRVWYYHRRGLTSTVQCPRSLLLSLYHFLLPLLFFSRRFSFLCSLTAALRFRRIFHFGIFGPIFRAQAG